MEIEKVETLARELMAQHGLTAKGWALQFDKSITRMGFCRFYPGKTISLSKPLAAINSEETMRDAILHEIAHAIAGCKAGHGITWKLTARAIGAIPEACCKLANVVQVETAWQGICQDCQVKVSRLRRPLSGRTYTHTECQYKANQGRVTWTYKGKPVE